MIEENSDTGPDAGPDIEAILNAATQFARDCRHKMVTTEHLFLALLRTQIIDISMNNLGINVDDMKKETAIILKTKFRNIEWDETYKESLIENPSPKGTHALERIFNRAHTHVLLSGRNNLNLKVIDVLKSITHEKKSYSVYLLNRYGVNMDHLIKYYNDHYADYDATTELVTNTTTQAVKTLEHFCTNLNNEVIENHIEPIIGREIEINEITQTLARKTKSNALLIGDPGVGKTAFVEGLAYKIVHKQTASILKDCIIYSLEIGSLLAGCKYRGEFEEKIKVITLASELVDNSILFVDEAHMMRAGGSSTNGSVDFGGMVKPALSRGKIKMIASTTWEDFRKSFDKDRALMRRFNIISIDEPSRDDAVKIMLGSKENYQDYHNLEITDEALISSVDLAIKYISNRKLPDKSLDLVDAAFAKCKVNDNEKKKIITIKDIIFQVSKTIKMPIEVETTGTNILSNLEVNMKKFIYGQDEAIKHLSEAIYIAKAGLKDLNKPTGSFLFAGPTGVGKTEVCRELSRIFSIELLRYDMSEFIEKHSVSKLIGSPPGYVGFDDSEMGGGKLLNDVEKYPHSIVLFDEIEKAHPDIANILLQIMDNGFLTGSSGKRVDFRNVIIVMTTNLGSTEMEKENIGFVMVEKSGNDDKAIKQFFSPEFRNRLDAIVKFNKLDKKVMLKIIIKFIREMNALLVDKNISVATTRKLNKYLLEEGFNPKMGARPLARVINEKIKKPIAKKIIFEDLKDITITADIDNKNNITFN